jgi:hypothetical protein
VIAQVYAGPVEAYILGKVSQLYSLPVVMSNLPPLLHAIATRETIYRISLSRLMTSFPAAQAGKATIQVMHEEDMKLLDEIATGGLPLITTSLEVVPADSTTKEIYSTTMDYNPTFHEGSWYNMVRDTQKLEDLIAEREGRGL